MLHNVRSCGGSLCPLLTALRCCRVLLPSMLRTCPLQERCASINQIIDKYTKKLQERTRHHMG